MALFALVEGKAGHLVAHPNGPAKEGAFPRYIGQRFVALPQSEAAEEDRRKSAERFVPEVQILEVGVGELRRLERCLRDGELARVEFVHAKNHAEAVFALQPKPVKKEK